MDDTDYPNFTGKLLVVHLIGRDGQVTNIIQDARFEIQAGRLFLVGEIVQNPVDNLPLAGLKNAMAWDQVADYTVVDSVDDLLKRLGITGKKNWWFG